MCVKITLHRLLQNQVCHFSLSFFDTFLILWEKLVSAEKRVRSEESGNIYHIFKNMYIIFLAYVILYLYNK